MTDRTKERRACQRFVIPGATVYYKQNRFLFYGKFTEDFYPVFDISRGGMRFLCQRFLKTATDMTLKLIVPAETAPLLIKGRVSWISPNPGKSYKYQVGIQFAPYGKNKGDNDPAVLQGLTALEKKFGAASSI